MDWRERMTMVVVEPDLCLEAVWQAGGPRGAVIAAPHPLHGGNFHHPVCNELAYGLYEHRIASLRFNWRGVGGSQGEATGEIEAGIEDFAAALDHLRDSVEMPTIGAGYSFGAAIAAHVGLRRQPLQRLVLVAPPPDMLRTMALNDLRLSTDLIVGQHDQIAPVDELKPLVDRMPNGRLHVIPNADHYFSGQGLAEISRVVERSVQRSQAHIHDNGRFDS